ncbi:MAG TPA: decaprenyl-phosphate phosphoribosyltransferase [Solirubrobacteraceae bacterium]|nr:decaprenyl-phosphate phosphoribosyltransferase [Solirubrobacteraceae bacterium]
MYALYRRFTINSFEAVANDEGVRLHGSHEDPQAPPQLRLAGLPQPAEQPLARALLRASRPRQWSKNLLVLAAPCAAGVIDRPLVAAQVAGAFVVLCLLSSATYLVNDVRDREQDRLHPRKRMRPVAAGELSPRAALVVAAVLALLGIAGATAIAAGLGVLACGYLALTASYSLWWRGVVLADILAIAAGFVLRAFAGGVATDIYLSRWFVIVTASCAIFLVAAKRYAELREQVGPGPARPTLRRYSTGNLRLMLLAAAAVGGVAYVSWAFTRPSHVVWYALSIAPFLLWLARYATLVGAGAGQAPEELILRDRLLLSLSIAWTLLFLGGVYVGR